jgi:hypothetical protein
LTSALFGGNVAFYDNNIGRITGSTLPPNLHW